MARELTIRTLGVLGYGPISLIVFYLGGIPLLIEIAIATVICEIEFYWMMKQAGFRPFYKVGIAVGLVFVLDAYFKLNILNPTIAGFLVLSVIWMAVEEWRFKNVDASLRRKSLIDWMLTLIGAIYAGMFLSYGILIRELPNGLALSMFALIGTASCDIFSFLAGRTLGHHQLAPSISPKKTIEGALGGWVFSVIACFSLGQLFQVQIWHSIVLGGIIGLAAITGDLAESVIKRSAGVKDAGTWIPEQGGLLDVIDGLLFVLVAVYYYGALIMRVAG